MQSKVLPEQCRATLLPAAVLRVHADNLASAVELKDSRHFLLGMREGGLGTVVIDGTPPHAMAGQERSGVVACLRQVAHQGRLVNLWPTHLHQSKAREQAPEQLSLACIRGQT